MTFNMEILSSMNQFCVDVISENDGTENAIWFLNSLWMKGKVLLEYIRISCFNLFNSVTLHHLQIGVDCCYENSVSMSMCTTWTLYEPVPTHHILTGEKSNVLCYSDVWVNVFAECQH